MSIYDTENFTKNNLQWFYPDTDNEIEVVTDYGQSVYLSKEDLLAMLASFNKKSTSLSKKRGKIKCAIRGCRNDARSAFGGLVICVKHFDDFVHCAKVNYEKGGK